MPFQKNVGRTQMDQGKKKPMLEDGPPLRKDEPVADVNPYINLSSAGLREKAKVFDQRWNTVPSDPSKLREDLLKKFHLTEPITAGTVDAAQSRQLKHLLNLNSECMKRNLTGNEDEECMETTRHLASARRALLMSAQHLVSSAALYEPPEQSSMMVQKHMGFSFEMLGERDLTPFQTLILFLLHQSSMRNYRKLNGSMFTEVKTENGMGTHSWKEDCTIEEFVLKQTSKDTNFDYWKMRTSMGDLVVRLTEYLDRGIEPELPTLKPDRFWSSWRNGMYHISSNTFYPYGSPQIPPDVVAHTLFNHEFDIETISSIEPGHYMSIPTPAFDRVLKTQELGSEFQYKDSQGFNWWAKKGETSCILGKVTEVPKKDELTESGDPVFEKRWVFHTEQHGRVLARSPEELEAEGWKPVMNGNPHRILLTMMGRMLYPLYMDDDRKVARDNWQRIMYVLGPAGNGKSTIANIIRSWFNPRDVGILNSNCEEQWALSGIFDKFVWMCYEVRQNFRLDTASFQSIVSGESTCINKKRCDPFDITWNSPGALFGNEMPRHWHDGGGSLIRRILLFRFQNTPSQMDPNLFKEIEAEMSLLMYKCNALYLQTLDRCVKKGKIIDAFLSPYFRDTKEYLMNGVHTLISFLQNCDDLEYGESSEFYIPMKELSVKYYEFCHAMKVTSKTWNEDFWQMPFKQKRLTVQKMKLPWPPKSQTLKETMYVRGVRAKEFVVGEDSTMSEDYSIKRKKFRD